MALDTFKPYLFVSAGEQSDKYLTPTMTNGIARFQAQRAQKIMGLTVQFGPIQSGTGDPSPENIRPISGRTGMTVRVAGRNLFETKNVGRTHNGVTYALQTDGEIALTGTASDTSYLYASPTANMLSYIPAGTYTLSGAASSNIRLVATTYEVSGDTVTRIADIAEDTGAGASFTLTADSWVGINIRVQSGQATNVSIGIQVEAGTATAYTPYVGQAYPVTWETEAGTVYGGTLDVTTGVLTVGKVLIDLGSVTNWRYNQSGAGAFDTNGDVIPIAKNNDCICTNYKTLDNPTVGKITSGDNLVCINKKDDGTGYTGSYATGTLVVKDSRYSDVETFKAAMNGVMLCYTIATPQVIQLDPEQIMTIPGFNQIYSDAGPVIDIQF